MNEITCCPECGMAIVPPIGDEIAFSCGSWIPYPSNMIMQQSLPCKRISELIHIEIKYNNMIRLVPTLSRLTETLSNREITERGKNEKNK